MGDWVLGVKMWGDVSGMLG